MPPRSSKTIMPPARRIWRHARHTMPRAACEARVVHDRDRRMRGEQRGDRLGVVAVALHAQGGVLMPRSTGAASCGEGRRRSCRFQALRRMRSATPASAHGDARGHVAVAVGVLVAGARRRARRVRAAAAGRACGRCCRRRAGRRGGGRLRRRGAGRRAHVRVGRRLAMGRASPATSTLRARRGGQVDEADLDAEACMPWLRKA